MVVLLAGTITPTCNAWDMDSLQVQQNVRAMLPRNGGDGMMKHRVAAAISTILACLACATYAAEPWPQRPVRFVVGFPPGGGIDVVARLLAVPMTQSIGQQVIVDNRPGANGILGTDLVAKANPDGHTVFIGTTGNLSLNPIVV